jgi:hypothetical protein
MWAMNREIEAGTLANTFELPIDGHSGLARPSLDTAQ